ncbi:MAG: hypothetical protein RLZZ127_1628, partial [Planctomycetota bacterium]
MTRRLAPTLLTCALAGLLPAAEGPVAEVVVPDLGRTLDRIEQGVWGKTWNDAALAPWRAQAATAAAKAAAQAGFDPIAALRALKDGRAVLHRFAMTDGTPDAAFQAQARLGELTGAVWTAFRKTVPRSAAAAQVPGAVEAVTFQESADIPLTIARFADAIVLGAPAAALAPGAVPATPADLSLVCDQTRLQAMILAVQAEDDPAIAKAGEDLLKAHPELFGQLTWTITAVPEGFHERITAGANPAAMPVDRAILDRLPANTLAVLAAGIDGGKAWEIYGPYLLDVIIATMNRSGSLDDGTTPEALVSQADAFLQMQGLDVGVKDLAAGMRGTVVMAVTPSMPFPAVTLAVPRSPALDKVVAWALGQAGLELPAEGSPLPISLPNVPVAPTLIADKGHWVISTDGMVANGWAAGQSGGFATGKAGAEALKRAPADAAIIGASDTPAVLRTIGGFLAMAPIQDRKQKQVLMAAVNRLAANAATGWVWSRSGTDRSELELRGVAGSVVVPAILAAVAIPNLLESRATANRVAAATSLRSGMFPAQIQFQAGAYRDRDGDGRGEYGLIGHLAGDMDAEHGPKQELALLHQGFRGIDPVRVGYRFRVYVPTGAEAGSADPAEVNAVTDPAVIDLQESHFLAYAWPEDGEGDCFALGPNGQVYSAPFAEVGEPAWNSLLGGQAWGAEPDES